MDIFNDPVLMAKVGAIALLILGLLRIVGQGFIRLGNTGKYAANDNDWFDSIGAFIMNIVAWLGKVMAFFGLGNRKS